MNIENLICSESRDYSFFFQFIKSILKVYEIKNYDDYTKIETLFFLMMYRVDQKETFLNIHDLSSFLSLFSSKENFEKICQSIEEDVFYLMRKYPNIISEHNNTPFIFQAKTGKLHFKNDLSTKQ